MFLFTYHGVTFTAEELLKYSRKSRTDDPLMSVEEVLEKHEKILNEWSVRHLGGIVPETNSFKEIVSGETIDGRPEIQKVLRLIEKPKYKAILCVEAQRLSRGDLEDAGRLIKLLRYTNTFVITPDMAFDLNDEYDRERFERELKRGNEFLEYYKKISWRGRVESVKAGWYIGSIAPYGYEKTTVFEGKRERYTLKIVEDEAEAVRRIFDMYVNEDMGMTNIAHRLNAEGFKTRKGGLWSTATIKSILINEHYMGKVVWDKRKNVNIVEDGEISKSRPTRKDFHIFDGQHPAIIDDELFAKATEKQGKNHRTKSGVKLRNPLATLVYCQCGKAMTYRTYKDPSGKERSVPRLLCTNQMYCHTQSVAFDDMLDKVIDILNNCIADYEVQIKNDSKNTQANHQAHIKRLEAKLEELNKKELSQWEKYSEEGMPKHIFDKLNEKVVQDKEATLKALEDARSTTPTVELFKERVMRFTDAVEALKNPKVSTEDKNRLLKACIERIDYKREKGSRWEQTPYELDVKLKL